PQQPESLCGVFLMEAEEFGVDDIVHHRNSLLWEYHFQVILGSPTPPAGDEHELLGSRRVIQNLAPESLSSEAVLNAIHQRLR
ncbi:hypothetical protein, partial [Micrococcus sp. F3Y]|uniref:hypothetical protein n=1 Tax=Micrococcus sp. F3Y TaxID=3402627 RepID=UPI003AF883D0